MDLTTEQASGVFDLMIEISKGNVNGVTGVHVFGENPDVDTGTDPEDVWHAGGTYTFLAAASTIYVSSDDQTDTEIEITVEGLDANWATQTVTVETDDSDGRTFVALTGTWIRVNRAYVSGADAPSGNVYISSDNTDAGGDGIPDDATTIKAQILTGHNESDQAIYSIPASTTGYIAEWFADGITGTVSQGAIVSLLVREFGGVFRIIAHTAISINDRHQRTFPFPHAVPEKGDILIRCDTVDADDSVIYGGFCLILVED